MRREAHARRISSKSTVGWEKNATARKEVEKMVLNEKGPWEGEAEKKKRKISTEE